MTKITVSDSKEYFAREYVDPKIATYVFYSCEHCGNEFQLVQPDNNFQVGAYTAGTVV
jgi:hypothetical protein